MMGLDSVVSGLHGRVPQYVKKTTRGVLVQSGNNVSILGVVHGDITDSKLSFSLLEPNLWLGGPENGEFETDSIGCSHCGLRIVLDTSRSPM